jgi:hypothetical protein
MSPNLRRSLTVATCATLEPAAVARDERLYQLYRKAYFALGTLRLYH